MTKTKRNAITEKIGMRLPRVVSWPELDWRNGGRQTDEVGW